MKINRPRWLIFLVAMALLCLGTYFILSSQRQPLHEGKPIKYWADNACVGADNSDRWRFRKEIKEIGAPAMPYVLQNLRAKEGGRDQWNAFQTHLPDSWQKRFPALPSAHELRYSSARTLEFLGPIAKSAVPDLILLLPEISSGAIAALASIGPDAQEALPALHPMLTNKDVQLREQVASALWQIGHETNVVLEICTNILTQSPGNAMNSCALLSHLGTAALPAAPFVLQVLQDTNSNARGNAAIVLGNIRLSTPEIRQALLDGLKPAENKGLQANCALALWAFDTNYAPLATRLVIEKLAEAPDRFEGKDEGFPRWLSYRGLDASQSVPTLRGLLTNDSPEIRAEAVKALAKIESDAKISGKK